MITPSRDFALFLMLRSLILLRLSENILQATPDSNMIVHRRLLVASFRCNFLPVLWPLILNTEWFRISTSINSSYCGWFWVIHRELLSKSLGLTRLLGIYVSLHLIKWLTCSFIDLPYCVRNFPWVRLIMLRCSLCSGLKISPSPFNKGNKEQQIFPRFLNKEVFLIIQLRTCHTNLWHASRLIPL